MVARMAGLVGWGMVALSAAQAQDTRAVVGNEHFSVNAPDEASARWILHLANHWQAQIARTWGKDLVAPPGRKTIIHWEPAPEADEAYTWLATGGGRKCHLVWLRTSPQRLPQTLAHELVHIVLAQHYGAHLPVWVQEGVAAMYDDAATGSKRVQVLQSWLRTSRLPKLGQVLGTTRLHPHDQSGYTAAVLLTRFLLDRGNREQLFTFARLGPRRGWPHAAWTVYRTSLSELEQKWHEWILQRGQQALIHEGFSPLQERLVPVSTRRTD